MLKKVILQLSDHQHKLYTYQHVTMKLPASQRARPDLNRCPAKGVDLIRKSVTGYQIDSVCSSQFHAGAYTPAPTGESAQTSGRSGGVLQWSLLVSALSERLKRVGVEDT